jgi:transposase
MGRKFSRMTSEDEAAIVVDHEGGASIRELADKYRRSKTTIVNVLHRTAEATDGPRWIVTYALEGKSVCTLLPKGAASVQVMPAKEE